MEVLLCHLSPMLFLVPSEVTFPWFPLPAWNPLRQPYYICCWVCYNSIPSGQSQSYKIIIIAISLPGTKAVRSRKMMKSFAFSLATDFAFLFATDMRAWAMQLWTLLKFLAGLSSSYKQIKLITTTETRRTFLWIQTDTGSWSPWGFVGCC